MLHYQIVCFIIHVADSARLLLAIAWCEADLDFADALHLASSQNAKTFMTFNQAFSRKVAGLGVCQVVEPT